MTVNFERAASATTVAVLGAGSWGTTFAKVVADAATASGVERDIRLWGRRPEIVDQINTLHRNEQYLNGITLPSSITASKDVSEVLSGAELVILAVPAQTLRPQLQAWKEHLAPGAVVISLQNGLHNTTRLRAALERRTPANPVLAGMVVQPFEAAREVIDFYAQITTAASDELTCLLVLQKAPPAPWIPEAIMGK